MRRVVALFLVVLGFGGFLAGRVLAPAFAEGPHAAVLRVDSVIQPAIARFLSRGVDSATEGGAQFIVVQLDTPGGLLSSTRDMVEKILASDIPVIVYVSPPGAQAASAGTFITAAAHLAAMAPTTNIGAASPVGSGGSELPETIKSKATEDAAAFMRSIAEERGRNAKALEQTVLKATSYSASEALEDDIIDIVAADMQDLLAQLDGRRVELADGEVVLDTEGLELLDIDRTPVERFLGFLANPDVAFLLVTLGGLGILVEFLSPGLMGPGIVGVIALVLGFVALGSLPVNWVGVALMGLAMVLFYLEFQAPGVGVFGVTGAVSFVLGAFLLFGGFSFSPPAISTPSFRVNIWLIIGITAAVFGFLMFVVRDMAAARTSGTTDATAPTSVVGQAAVVRTELAPRGSVEIAGEHWSAVSDSGETIAKGSEATVVGVEGLVLKVAKPIGAGRFRSSRYAVEGPAVEDSRPSESGP